MFPAHLSMPWGMSTRSLTCSSSSKPHTPRIKLSFSTLHWNRSTGFLERSSHCCNPHEYCSQINMFIIEFHLFSIYADGVMSFFLFLFFSFYIYTMNHCPYLSQFLIYLTLFSLELYL